MYLITNGKAVTRRREKPFIENGAVAVDGNRIAAVGSSTELSARFPDAEIIDAEGGVIMPGLIDAHTHLYTSFMRGMPRKDELPETYYESLTNGKWRYDRTFGFFDSAYGALLGAVECIKNGVTTVFDHHASYGSVSGALLAASGMIAKAGIRASLAYDTGERCGYEACCEAIDENTGFIEYCSAVKDERLTAMFGLGEPFSLRDFDIDCCVKRNASKKPFHVHFSEGPDDMIVSLHSFGESPAERLNRLGVLSGGSILAGCAGAGRRDLDAIAGKDVFAVCCPNSDMSRGLGPADYSGMFERGITVGLGTDGSGFDPLMSARAYILTRQDIPESLRIREAAKLLFENNRLIAERSFEKGIGTLKEGAPADVIIMDHDPFTPMNETNIDEHIIFGMSGRCVMTMAAGKVLMRGGKLCSILGDEDIKVIKDTAADLYKRLEEHGEYEWSKY